MTSIVRTRLKTALSCAALSCAALTCAALTCAPALAQDTPNARPVTEKQVGRSTVRFFVTPAPTEKAAQREALVSLLENRLAGETPAPAKAVRQETLGNGMVRAALPVELWNVPFVTVDGAERVQACTDAAALPAASEMKSSPAKGVE